MNLNSQDDVDVRLQQYMLKRAQPNYANECGMLIQDKAQLLNELDQLRSRNITLERELRELMRSYDELQSEDDQQKLYAEKSTIQEIEIQSLKSQNEQMKVEFRQQLELLQRELDLTIKEKLALAEENLQLRTQVPEQQQLYEQVFEKNQDKKKVEKQINHFKKEVQKLKTIVKQKIVQKKNKQL